MRTYAEVETNGNWFEGLEQSMGYKIFVHCEIEGLKNLATKFNIRDETEVIQADGGATGNNTNALHNTNPRTTTIPENRRVSQKRAILDREKK